MRDQPAPQLRNKKISIGFLSFILLLALGVSSGFAQSLGDVAREERERREQNPRRPRVYTNEDLMQPRIAVRESRQETDAAESAVAGVPDQAPAEPVSLTPVAPPLSLSIVWPKDVPLGDVARFYRQQRERELVKDLQFAIEAPPVLDLDFLLPTPLASPLSDFAGPLLDFTSGLSRDAADQPLPPSSVPEPVWDDFAEPENTVRVERGDTLWGIAERHLGDGRAWPKIAGVNPDLKDPNRIRVGQALRLPSPETVNFRASNVSSSENTVRVQAGDSLWNLAAARMGTGNAWNCIAAANPQIEDANRIYPGQLLVIPADCHAGA